MAENSKAVRERAWSARGLKHNLVEQRLLVIDGAESDLGSGAGEHVAALIDLGIGRLDAVTGRMLRADVDNVMEGLDDGPPRARRDELKETVRQLLMALRSGLETGWGPDLAVQMGIGPMPDAPEEVLQMARTVLKSWDARALPKPRLGIVIELGPMVVRLREQTGELAGALDEVAAEAAQAQTTLDAKRVAIAEFDRVFAVVASIGTSFLKLAGKDDLARGLKPSKRRPGRTNAVAEGHEPVPEAIDVPPVTGDDETLPAPAGESEAV